MVVTSKWIARHAIRVADSFLAAGVRGNPLDSGGICRNSPFPNVLNRWAGSALKACPTRHQIGIPQKDAGQCRWILGKKSTDGIQTEFGPPDSESSRACHFARGGMFGQPGVPEHWHLMFYRAGVVKVWLNWDAGGDINR